MTPPTRMLDAARALGMKVEEIVAVDGDLVTTFDGATYRLDGDHAELAAAPADAPETAPHPEPEPAEPVEISDAELLELVAARGLSTKPGEQLTDDEVLQLVADRGLTLPAEPGQVPSTVPPEDNEPPKPPAKTPAKAAAKAPTAKPKAGTDG